MASTKRLWIEIGLNISKARQALGGLRGAVNLFKSSMAALARTTFVGGIFAAFRAGFDIINDVSRAISQTAHQMAELQLASIKTASVISEGGSTFDAAFEQASATARELSTQVNFTAGQIQEGLFTAAQAGYNLGQALKFTQSSLMLAATSGEDFQSIMNDMIGLTRAFGFSSEKIPQMADAIAGAAQKSKVTVSGLFEGLKNVASVANVAFGETLDTFTDMTSAIMTLNDAGIENSVAGNKMRAALQQLNSGTAKTTAVFSKYGINIYKANAGNQKYLDTLMKSQKAFAGYDDQLNDLKNRQLELVTSGKQGGDEYNRVTKEIEGLTEQISVLESGMDRVEGQFKLAGGQLKPFHELLQDLQKAPKEAIGRAFGIRGGEAILRLMQNSKNFFQNRSEVERFMTESERGASILQKVYEKFFSSVLVRWQVMKNDVVGMFSVIADSAFQAFGPLFDPIELGLKKLFQGIEANKDSFRKIFEGVANLLKPIVTQIGMIFGLVGENIKNIFNEGQSVTLPIVSYNRKEGRFEETKQTADTISSKILLAAHALVSVITAAFQAAMAKLEPSIKFLGSAFVDALSAALQIKTELFLKMGSYVAQGFIQFIRAELPRLIASLKHIIATEFPKLGNLLGMKNPAEAVGDATAGGLLKTNNAGFGPFMPKLGLRPIKTNLGDRTIDDLMASGAANIKETAAVKPTGSGTMEVNGELFEIDFNAMNGALSDMRQVGSSFSNTLDTTAQVFKKLGKAELESRRKAESMQRDRALKDLKAR